MANYHSLDAWVEAFKYSIVKDVTESIGDIIKEQRHFVLESTSMETSTPEKTSSTLDRGDKSGVNVGAKAVDARERVQDPVSVDY